MLEYTNVRPCQPVAAYIGGKSRLADTIIRRINSVPHETYAECFVGMGGIFLRRDYRPRSEVINDYSRDVSNFFRVLQVHYVAFMDMMKWQITTRAEFDRLLAVDPATLTDMQRAARFLYLQRTAFGGKVSGRNFGVAPARPARFDITKLASALEEVHERLSSVTIEALHYRDFINVYDRPTTLFYLDPPYYRCESDYGAALFNRDEFALIAAQLAEIKGRFILSLNDCPEVREIFKAFDIETLRTTYSVGGGANQQEVAEVLITNAMECFKVVDLFAG